MRPKGIGDAHRLRIPGAAFSHSTSVGRRAPAHAAYASASKYVTCCTGSSAGMSSTWPNRVRVPSAIPELRRGQPRLLTVRPAAVRPPPRLPVATVVDELPPLAVGHRHPADPEGRHVDDVCGALVVERVRFADRVDAEDERTAGHQHRRARHSRPAGRQQRSRCPSIGGPDRRFSACSIVSSCWFSWLITSPNRKAAPASASSDSASRVSSALSRTVAQYVRASAGGSSGSSTRLARECTNAS